MIYVNYYTIIPVKRQAFSRFYKRKTHATKTLKVKVSDVCRVGGGGESRTHVLLGYQKPFYILSLSIIS